MKRILWTEPALVDLEAIRDYIARDSDVYAAATVERILEAVERIGAFPRAVAWCRSGSSARFAR